MKLISIVFISIYITGFCNAQEADLLLPKVQDREISIHHKAFSLSYNTSYLQPSWVAYKVANADVDKTLKASEKYKEDPQITSRSASKKDFKQGGYLMAQFVSYLDVASIPDAHDETFYLSNITPMKLAYYKHIWIKSEDLVRQWAKDSDGLYVVCGPILADSPFPAIGDNNVSVPKRYYKAIYDAKNKKAVGFIFRNGSSSGSLKSYSRSIDIIEEETGIDLFPSLDDELENKIESNIDYSQWNFELANP